MHDVNSMRIFSASCLCSHPTNFIHPPFIFLSNSGQLNVETHACALSDCYTFGPTFRAENSNTYKHLAEFWMIEPEISFATLDDDAGECLLTIFWIVRKFNAMILFCFIVTLIFIEIADFSSQLRPHNYL